MTYATRTDLVDRFGSDEIAQRETALSSGATTKALADADALINDYVSGRYAVPLTPVPDSVSRLAAELARYFLLGTAVTDDARTAFDNAVAWLKDVQAGRVTLTAAHVADHTATGGKAATRTRTKQFDSSGLQEY